MTVAQVLAVAAALTATAAAAGCAARQPPPDHALIDTDDPASAPAAAGPIEAPSRAEPAAPLARRRTGEVARQALDRVLRAGPGAFLARVEVRAHLVAGSFAGWEVVRSPYPEVNLLAGDVVLSVNGHTLEHPLDLEALWRELARAGAIRVEVARAGQRFALAFKVVSGGAAAPAAHDKVAP